MRSTGRLTRLSRGLQAQPARQPLAPVSSIVRPPWTRRWSISPMFLSWSIGSQSGFTTSGEGRIRTRRWHTQRPGLPGTQIVRSCQWLLSQSELGSQLEQRAFDPRTFPVGQTSDLGSEASTLCRNNDAKVWVLDSSIIAKRKPGGSAFRSCSSLHTIRNVSTLLSAGPFSSAAKTAGSQSLSCERRSNYAFDSDAPCLSRPLPSKGPASRRRAGQLER
jgi:hypothetical protein